jgi:two-component system response regulator HydG
MEIIQFIPSTQRRFVLLAAQTDNAPVLIVGASGTGKSALARWIQSNGPRSALPLISSKLLLHFLKTKTVPHPQNPSLTVVAQARIIATSSYSLEGRAKGGLFNGDLLQKLSLFRLETPDLSKRLEDFEDIVSGLLEEITHELHREHIRGLTPEAWTLLKQYEWPGNIREIRNVLRVAALKAGSDLIEPKDLPDFGHEKSDFRGTRAEFEKVYLVELLKTFDWQIDQACQVSRMDRKTLLEKMEKFGISPIK